MCLKLFVTAVSHGVRSRGRVRDQASGGRPRLLGGDQTLCARPVLEVLAVRPAFLLSELHEPALGLFARSPDHPSVAPPSLPSEHRVP